MTTPPDLNIYIYICPPIIIVTNIVHLILRFWWLKANALAESSNWFELENFSKTKKNSPIGYRPFVEACAKWGNKAEAAKYLARVSPDEKVKCLISIG